MKNIYEMQAANKRKSFAVVLFFFVFTGISVFLIIKAIGIYYGYEVGGLGIGGFALIVSGLSSLIGYYFSDSLVLAISKAKEADRKTYFNFYTTCENLAIASGIRKPRMYVIEDSAKNAFATGRNPDHAVVCATTGLLNSLNRNELEGVLAHEISHIRNYDTRLQSLVAVMVGLISLLGDFLLRGRLYSRSSSDEDRGAGTLVFLLGMLFAFISPIVAELIKLAISRRREYMADAGSVSLTRQTSGLISALKKISEDREVLEVANKATAHLYIISPFKSVNNKTNGWFVSLFNTHPPVEDRIKALKEMS